MSIVINDLTHTYLPDSPYRATAIENISLTIEKGDFLGIIGHTGCGKSTLVQHMNGLLKPTSGSVLIDGVNLWDKNTPRKEIRQRVGLVFQYPETQLFEETVRKDIAFGPRNMGLEAEEIEERVLECCKLVGLSEDYLEKSPFELSGGQKRRVAIAGVLALRPSTLVLDEPTAGLDPRGREEILEMIRLWHEAGQTVVMVTHAMDDIARLCKRAIVMNQGHLWMEGSPREIFARAQSLLEIGLDIPAATQMALMLKERGMHLPDGIGTIDELAKAIIKAREGGES